MTPIRVAHLIHTMAHGGVETALINWLRTFDRGKVDACLLCFANPGGTERPFIEAAARAGLHVDTIPWGDHKPVLAAARATAAWLRASGTELLHCHNTYANLVGLVGRAHGSRARTLTTVYVWSGYGVKRRMLQWVDSGCSRRFDQVTAHCEAALRATVGRGMPAERVPAADLRVRGSVAQLDRDRARARGARHGHRAGRARADQGRAVLAREASRRLVPGVSRSPRTRAEPPPLDSRRRSQRDRA